MNVEDPIYIIAPFTVRAVTSSDNISINGGGKQKLGCLKLLTLKHKSM